MLTGLDHPWSDGGHDVASRRLPGSVGIAYRTHPRIGLTISVIDGEVTEDDFRELARCQGDDADWHASTCSLTDARTALTPSVAPESLGAFAAQYAQMRATDRPWRAAIVTGHDSQLAARYSELRTDDQTRTIVFDDLTSACMWLDVDLETVRGTITALREELLARSG